MATRAPGETMTGPAVGAKEHATEICTTCVLLPDCVHRRELRPPILQCELYEERQWSFDLVTALVDRHLGQRGGLISTLEGIQAKYGYLPEGALRAVAERTGRSLVDIYGVATFYRSFSLKYNPGVLTRHYLDGQLTFGQIVEGEISGTLDLEFESTALAVSQYYDKMTAQTPVFLKLANIGPVLGGSFYSLTFYIYGYVTDVKPIASEDEGINIYTATIALDYDPVGAHHLTATLVCSLAAIP